CLPGRAHDAGRRPSAEMEERREARKPSRLHRPRITGAGDPDRLRKLHHHVMSGFDPGERPSIVSLTDRVKPVAIGAAVTSVHYLGDRAAFVGAEESVSLVDAEGAISKVETHGGGILCAVSDGKRLIAGGDDGRVVALDAKGKVTQLAVDAKRRWIDNVAVHPDG